MTSQTADNDHGQTSKQPSPSPDTPPRTPPASESSAPLRSRLRSHLASTGDKPAGKSSSETAAPSPPAPKPQETAAKTAEGEAPQATVAAEKPAAPQAPASKPAAPPPAPPPRPQGKVPVPSRRAALPADVERELQAALGEASVDDLMQRSQTSLPTTELELESRRRATVVRMHGDNVFFSLGGPNEGFASLRQFHQPPDVGDEMDVVIRGYNAEDGLYEVGVPGASIDVGDWSDIVEGSLVEARVTAVNTGGLECMVNHIRAFIPASQVALYRTEDFSEYLDQKLLCVVTEANPDRRNLVLSRRSVLEREKEESRRQMLEEMQEGEVREGIVRNIRDFGAFVDLGGLDGLIHVSQLSWDRVNHPRDVLEEGQKVKVRVEKIDRQTGKIGLSLRSLQEHPWEKVPQLFPVGSIAKGEVTRIAKFGAFVKLIAGVEGLIHISELSHHRVAQVSNVVQEGQQVEVKIVSLDLENQRIGLSMKALAAAPTAAPEEPEAEEEAAPAAQQSRKQRAPLKGGLERGSGGESFGLKW